ncbi:MAG: transcription antitermination factor NusB [Rickettsiaceae bacterium]|nr:transcription antitermination factor NusB [Rickettsiaceae bacterium]
MTSINSKTIARIAAIQAIYQSINQKDHNLPEIAMKIKSLYQKSNNLDLFELDDKKLRVKLNVATYDIITDFYEKSKEKIGNILIKYFTQLISFEQTSQTMQALLIAAVTEALIFPELHMGILVSEYTNIASEMLHDKEIGVVNSILENAIKDIRANETSTHQS